MVPLFTAIGNIGAIVFVYWHLFTRVKVRFCPVTWREVWTELKDSSQFFLSKVAGSINSNLNGILLGALAGSTATGLYTNADKVIGAARSGMSPIADSLYPHMMKHRNFGLIKKAMLIVYPIILAGCAIVFVFAEPLLVFWLGEEGSQVVLPLRLLIPVAVFCFPNYVLGYPTMGAHGPGEIRQHPPWCSAPLSIWLGRLFAGSPGASALISLCVLTSVTEGSILAFRLVVNCEKPQADGYSHGPAVTAPDQTLFCQAGPALLLFSPKTSILIVVL